MSRKNYLKMRLTTQQIISNILCKIVVNDVINKQNILKDIFEDKRGQSQKWWRRETDFLLWNSEQGTGEWLLIRKLFGTFFTSKLIFSPEWVLGGFWDFPIPKMTWDILYKGGEGEFFGKWLLPRKWLLLGNSKYITF